MLKSHDIPQHNNMLDRRTGDASLPRDPARSRHFRTMFGPSRPEDRYSGTGDVAGSLRLLQELADVMARAPEEEGFFLPAGYTYFAQLVSHDVSKIGGGEFDYDADGNEIERVPETQDRHQRLMLETLYGAGPDEDRIGLYGEGNDDLARWRLRQGRFRKSKAAGDLPRSCPFHPDATLPLFAADARNDVNLVTAQIAALFIALHNKAFDRLDGINAPDARFEAARLVTRFVYRSMVADDLMQRLLHPTVFAHYRNDGQLLDHPHGHDRHRFPAEFSHAVYRFGHSLIRHDYRVNDLIPMQSISEMLAETASQRPYAFPQDIHWKIDWRHYFGPDAQKALPLTPSIAGNLVEDPAVAIPKDYGDWTSDLVLRDLARGLDIGVLKVEALAGRIAALKPAEADGWLAFDSGRRKSFAKAWLTTCGLTDDDAERVAMDPPLFFYTLLEAGAPADAGGGEGRHLGFLASVVVAEKIFASLKEHRIEIEGSPMLPSSLDAVFGPGALPGSMEQLTEFLK